MKVSIPTTRFGHNGSGQNLRRGGFIVDAAMHCVVLAVDATGMATLTETLPKRQSSTAVAGVG